MEIEMSNSRVSSQSSSPRGRSKQRYSTANANPLANGQLSRIGTKRYRGARHTGPAGSYPVLIDVDGSGKPVAEFHGFSDSDLTAIPRTALDALIKDLAVRMSDLSSFGVDRITARISRTADGQFTLAYRVWDGVTESIQVVPDLDGFPFTGEDLDSWTQARRKARASIENWFRHPSRRDGDTTTAPALGRVQLSRSAALI
jgi:hypothetical protein